MADADNELQEQHQNDTNAQQDSSSSMLKEEEDPERTILPPLNGNDEESKKPKKKDNKKSASIGAAVGILPKSLSQPVGMLLLSTEGERKRLEKENTKLTKQLEEANRRIEELEAALAKEQESKQRAVKMYNKCSSILKKTQNQLDECVKGQKKQNSPKLGYENEHTPTPVQMAKTPEYMGDFEEEHPEEGGDTSTATIPNLPKTISAKKKGKRIRRDLLVSPPPSPPIGDGAGPLETSATNNEHHHHHQQQQQQRSHHVRSTSPTTSSSQVPFGSKRRPPNLLFARKMWKPGKTPPNGSPPPAPAATPDHRSNRPSPLEVDELVDHQDNLSSGGRRSADGNMKIPPTPPLALDYNFQTNRDDGDDGSSNNSSSHRRSMDSPSFRSSPINSSRRTSVFGNITRSRSFSTPRAARKVKTVAPKVDRVDLEELKGQGETLTRKIHSLIEEMSFNAAELVRLRKEREIVGQGQRKNEISERIEQVVARIAEMKTEMCVLRKDQMSLQSQISAEEARLELDKLLPVMTSALLPKRFRADILNPFSEPSNVPYRSDTPI